MKARDVSRSCPVNVVGFYWADNELYFFVIPYAGYEGIVSINKNKCEIIDLKVDHFTFFSSEYGGDAFLHECAADENLISRMLDHAPGANDEFLRRCSARGVDWWEKGDDFS